MGHPGGGVAMARPPIAAIALAARMTKNRDRLPGTPPVESADGADAAP